MHFLERGYLEHGAPKDESAQKTTGNVSVPKRPSQALEAQRVLTVTGESTLCTLLSSTKISLETEDQGHHSQVRPGQSLTTFYGGRGRYAAVPEPL